jgi:hypothetical protein
MQNTIVIISSRNLSSFAHRLARETSSFIHTIEALTLLKSVVPFVPKMGCGSPHTRHTRPISRCQTSSSSVMLRIACKESYWHHVRNCLQKLVKYWTRDRPRLCRASSRAGLRAQNGFLRITVSNIDKIHIHWFSFWRLLSGTEMLRLVGTPCRTKRAILNYAR